RYIVVRRSPQDTLLLAVVTAAPDADGAYASAIEQVAEHALAQPGVDGFHWLVNDSLADMSFGTPQRHWGADLLDMRVGSRTLAIGPNTFFQNNIHLLLPLLNDVAAAVTADRRPPTTEDMSQVVSRRSSVVGRQSLVVADLYGGVGTIALHLADQVGHVTCVESVEESAQLAEHNIARNRVRNITMVAANVLAFLREQSIGQFDVVVADPPRVGLGPDVCRELLRVRPRRLVYVSCNALSQLDDARALASGYQLTELRGYDMFPQTPHMEALAVFERR
ncbi:MAG: methyltransferase, partial [Chloroflexota bacterium]|nr:methyltransferase [Chloroflexota bacterium]